MVKGIRLKTNEKILEVMLIRDSMISIETQSGAQFSFASTTLFKGEM